MTRAVANKLYRTFIKGLITEASPLTYPEDASTNEDNCVITARGNRTRRFGIDYEVGFTTVSNTVPQAAFNTYAIKEFVWQGVGNQSNTSFYVIQIGNIIYFYDVNLASVGIGLKRFTIDLTSFLAAGLSGVALTEVEFASGKGYLFVTGGVIEPFFVSYDPAIDQITATVITVQIRDFQGVNDGLTNDQEPTTLSASHQYNLQNQGWVNPTNDGSGPTVSVPPGYGIVVNPSSPSGGLVPNIVTVVQIPATSPSLASGPIQPYFTKFGRYPSNAQQWWVAQSPIDKASPSTIKAGDFDPELLAKFYFGSGRAPRGHYVLNAFKQDRSGVSGISGIPVVSTSPRPKAVSFFAGRAWYGLNDTLYFTQVLDDPRKVGFCYQEGDPTGQFTPDLLATDGGVIPIPDMINVQKLVPLGPGLMIFAENGVWFISGGSGGFKATDLAVSKISPIGTSSPNSIAVVEHVTETGSVANNTIYWWSNVGIQSVSPANGVLGPISGYFQKTLVSQGTIQGFFDDKISDLSKQYVKAIYDPATQVIQWLFKSDSNNHKYLYDRILNLDLQINAFYPWTITSNSSTPWIMGGATLPHLISEPSEEVVTTGGVAVTVSGINVTAGIAIRNIRNTFFKYNFAVPDNVNGVYYFRFGSFNNQSYVDWQLFTTDPLAGVLGAGYNYTSFIETGFELLDDAMRKKQTTYVFCYLEQTETDWVETDPDMFNLANSSSCTLTTKWDWTNSAAGKQWSTPVQVYRIKRIPRFVLGDAFDNGQALVVSKNKVRGQGKAIQFRLENSAAGTNFNIYGWSVEYTGNTSP